MTPKELLKNQTLINGELIDGMNFIQHWNAASKPWINVFSSESELAIDSIQQLLDHEDFKSLTDEQKGKILSLPNDQGNTPLQELALSTSTDPYTYNKGFIYKGLIFDGNKVSKIDILIFTLLAYPISIEHEKNPIWIQSWIKNRMKVDDSSLDPYQYPLNKMICEKIPQTMLEEFHQKKLHEELLHFVTRENIPNLFELYTSWTGVKKIPANFEQCSIYTENNKKVVYVGPFFYGFYSYSPSHISSLIISRIINNKAVNENESLKKIQDFYKQLKDFNKIISNTVIVEQKVLSDKWTSSDDPGYKVGYKLLPHLDSKTKSENNPHKALIDFITALQPEIKHKTEIETYDLQLYRISPTDYSNTEYFTLAVFVIANYTRAFYDALSQKGHALPEFPIDKIPEFYKQNPFPDEYKAQLTLLIQKTLENFVYKIITTDDGPSIHLFKSLTEKLENVLSAFNLSFYEIVKNNPTNIYEKTPIIENSNDLIAAIETYAKKYIGENTDKNEEKDPNIIFAKKICSSPSIFVHSDLYFIQLITKIIQFRLDAYHPGHTYDKSFYQKYLGPFMSDISDKTKRDLLPYKFVFIEQVNSNLRKLAWSVFNHSSFDAKKAQSLKDSLDLFCDKFSIKINELDKDAQGIYMEATKTIADQPQKSTWLNLFSKPKANAYQSEQTNGLELKSFSKNTPG